MKLSDLKETQSFPVPKEGLRATYPFLILTQNQLPFTHTNVIWFNVWGAKNVQWKSSFLIKVKAYKVPRTTYGTLNFNHIIS